MILPSFAVVITQQPTQPFGVLTFLEVPGKSAAISIWQPSFVPVILFWRILLLLFSLS
jgi:hypothetical protein